MSKKGLNSDSEIRTNIVNFRKRQAVQRTQSFEANQTISQDAINKLIEGLFTKGLTHDSGTILASLDDLDTLILALETGEQSDFNAIPLKGVRKLANPQAVFACELSANDPAGYTMPAPPTLASRIAAAEMYEVYEKCFNRDKAFTLFSSTAGADTDLDRTISVLNSFGDDFTGPKDSGSVTRQTLFRGKSTSELVGPYVSQFLLHDVMLGAHTIIQKSITKLGEYGISKAHYLNIQDGEANPASQQVGSAEYVWSPRVLGSFVHVDLVFQAYYYAACLLLGANASRNIAFPSQLREGGFITNAGAVDIVTCIAEVSRHAAKAAWHQKWIHLRLRPEAMAARFALSPSSVHSDLGALGDTLLNETTGLLPVRNLADGGEQKAYLPIQYAEGSPMHPSYPAGHAVIAGAATTLLKLFFADGSWSSLSGSLATPKIATDANTLATYVESDASNMTIHGELNKLASNMSIGRNFAGVHYRSDGDEGMLLGQKVAIEYFKDLTAMQNEDIGSVIINGFDNSKIIVKTPK